MKVIADDYLNGVDKPEINGIIDKLKNNKYGRLGINLLNPYKYEVVIPQK